MILLPLVSAVAVVDTTAQTSPRPPSASNEFSELMRSRGFSDEAIGVLQQDRPEYRAVMESFRPRQEALNRELSAAIRVPEPDPAIIDNVLRRLNALGQEVVEVDRQRHIDILSMLSPADRRIYLQLMDPLPPEGVPRPRIIRPTAPPAPSQTNR